jgi:hypothetical protein
VSSVEDSHSINFYQKARLCECGNPDPRGGRLRHVCKEPSEDAGYGRRLLGPIVDNVYAHKDDVGECATGGLDDGLQILEYLARLCLEVGTADNLPLRIPRNLAGQIDGPASRRDDGLGKTVIEAGKDRWRIDLLVPCWFTGVRPSCAA